MSMTALHLQPKSRPPNRLMRWAARISWLIIVLLTIWKTSLGLPLYFAEISSVCTASVEVCSQGNSLNPRQIEVLQSGGLSLEVYAQIEITLKIITALIWACVGFFIFWMRPNDWLAWIASAMMIN